MDEEEDWRAKFEILENLIKDASRVSKIYGITALGMLTMLDAQLSGEYERVGLEKMPFSTSSLLPEPQIMGV
jgi:hypothetical protein